MASYNPLWQYRSPQTYNEDSDSSSEEEEDECLLVDEVIERHYPDTWSETFENEYQLLNLSFYSQEYLRVSDKIHETLPVHINKIERVQNPFLWGCYLLKKGEYKKRLGKDLEELELFHATGEANVPSIAADNFDWRRTKRSKFGKGVSFSPVASYANQYCNLVAGHHRVLFLVKVLVGFGSNGHYGTLLPPPGCDTTTGRKNRVLVKYEDHVFYPEYVAYYTV